MRSWHLEAGLGISAFALGVVGACTFPTVDTADPSGSGGAPTGATTTLAGPTTTTTLAGPTATTEAGPATSTSSASSSEGGGTSSTSGSDGGGGTSSTSSDGGGGAGSTSTLTGVGGGVVDVACNTAGVSNGCVPFPEGGGGGSAGTGGTGPNGDCDQDGDLNLNDCQPCDPLVFHGQTEFFDVSFAPFEADAAPSFDYNCSGGDNYEYEAADDGCAAYSVDTCPEDDPIYTMASVSCGQSANVQDCQASGSIIGIAGSCVNNGPPTGMLVRCH